jgi:Flp pilus assembly pilin Flp
LAATQNIWAWLSDFWTETDGQDLIEYSLLLGFFAITSLAVLAGIKSSMTSIWTKVNSTLSSGTAAS